MRTYPKESKEAGSFFYGNWGEIPLGISLVKLDSSADNFLDTRHYHEAASEFYLVIEGKILVEVESQDVEVDSDKLLMIEPKEKHHVKQILSYPCIFVSISTDKGEKSDKVNINKKIS